MMDNFDKEVPATTVIPEQGAHKARLPTQEPEQIFVCIAKLVANPLSKSGICPNIWGGVPYSAGGC